ncbi:isocitrate/isopropylmalate dehydrogenase family protein [Nocardioides panaciterrulae]|uniref:3-isopropylmalate dehydrogenase n=1 Tax=Nocardioides panaciterrulae TaxID=661492 RepID=A0A7Y9J9E0_9ACTN|nr:isocitrate/isopropylmalate family dehydrogenase [Nocardioides panaciterrulae]NYD40465.1 3-isopropylmalate dehydrogenase [Nocardioides panaciterrulae]
MRLAVISGDGIGPELVDSALEVLTAVSSLEGFALEVVHQPGGAEHFLRTGEPLSADELDRLRGADAILKGPVGLPHVRRADGTEGGLLGGVLRRGLDTFANVRPVRLLPGVQGPTRHAPEDIDYVIVRENTEGLYLSRGAGVATPAAASDQLMITRDGTRRVVVFAFELARQRARARAVPARLTCVDKSNVLRSYALFRAVFEEIAADYPDVETDCLYADAAAHELVARPRRFDVLVMENFLGDVLSDLGAATAGGLGMCGSANIGAEHAYFEPIHGSAPAIAGQDRANPVSQILSAAMMLAHLGMEEAAARVQRAVESAFSDGAVVLDEAGSPTAGTRATTSAIVERLVSG